MANRPASSNKAKIARRVVEVLEYFDDAHRDATVMDIVRRYDRPQSSTSELLSSLVELGLLRKDREARTYSLTPRAALLGTGGQAGAVRDGRLVNYLFINARIQIAPGADIWSTREKGHFLRDALLKAVHRQSVVDASRDDALNTPAAQALVATVARQVLGASSVRSVEIMSVSSLRQGRIARS